MKLQPKVAIISSKRTPIGKVRGSLASLKPEEMFGQLWQGQSTRLKEKIIPDYVLLGNVMNLGGNIARRASLLAGIGPSVPAETIDFQCGSGLRAFINGANMIVAGDANIVVTGGLESTSQANQVLDPITKKPIWRFKMAPVGYEDLDMGIAAERLATQYKISRNRQDEYAYNSHKKAVAAIKAGKISREILALTVKEKQILKDDCVRADTSLAKLAQLKPAFIADGTCTAGNSCPLNDGAASVILGSLAQAKEIEGVYFGQVTVGSLPAEFLTTPIKATQKLMEKFQLTDQDISAYELNEAFAVQAIVFQEALQIPAEKYNCWGGALAFGHPFGATGGILITRMLKRLNEISHPALGIVTLCVAGGMGVSLLLGNKAWKK